MKLALQVVSILLTELPKTRESALALLGFSLKMFQEETPATA